MRNEDKTAGSHCTQWLELAKKLGTACLERQDKLRDLAPGSRLDDDERKQTLKAVCKLNRDIGKLADETAALEDGDFGVTAILDSPTRLQLITVSLMTVARLVGDVGRELREVEHLVDTVSGMDMEDALAVRNLFREDSPLRPHIHIAYSQTLDESDVRLSEAAINRILGNTPDKSERLTEAAALSRKWR